MGGNDDEFNTGTAFLLWLACLLGAAGVHRFYLGKKWTGLAYLFTWGFGGIGLVYDAMKMHQLVESANERRRALPPGAPQPLLAPATPNALPAATTPSATELRMALTKAAASNGGSLSVTQGVLATGQDFPAVEEALDAMAKSGYVGIDNDPKSGVLIYTFRELV
ncbi:MAG: TM2 domain-containing protein [Kofleriaceae bacterium]